MNKVRVFYKPDGQVSIVHPAPNARRKRVVISANDREVLVDETDDAFFKRIMARTVAANPALTGLDYEDVNKTTLPDRDKRGKWRGSKGQGVKIDNTVITTVERRQALEDEIDSELLKPTPDFKQIEINRRKIEKREY